MSLVPCELFHIHAMRIQFFVKRPQLYNTTLLHNWVAPESWTARSPCAFGNFFLSQTMVKITEIAVFLEAFGNFCMKKHPKIGVF